MKEPKQTQSAELDALEEELAAMEVNDLVVWRRGELKKSSIYSRMSKLDFDIYKFTKHDKFYFVRIK